MNICKRTIIMAAGVAVAALAVADPASASTATKSVRSFIFPVKATTTVRTQAFGNGGVWAAVTVQRTATVSGGYRCCRSAAALAPPGASATPPS